MKFFEAQKRASFAAKLFTAAGLNFDTLITAGDENALKTALGASAGYEALITGAGLDPKALLAAGPDALKLHIESLDDSEAAAALSAELATAKSRVTKLDSEVTELSGIVQHITSAIALPVAKDAKVTDIKTAFDSHVAKQTTLALAKTGHPPAHVPAANALDDVTPVKTDSDVAAAKALTDYEALIVAHNKSGSKSDEKAKADFYAKHSALITRGLTLRRRK